MSIPTDCRWDSFESGQKRNAALRDKVLEILKEKDCLTAREVSEELYKAGLIEENNRQASAPRLTELMDLGLVYVVDKIHDAKTKRTVSVYSVKGENKECEQTRCCECKEVTCY